MGARKLLTGGSFLSLVTAVAAFAQQSPEDAAAGAAACAACGGIGIVGVLIPLAIVIAIAVWMYKDAQKRGDQNAILWLIVGLVFPLIGLIVYLIIRAQKPTPPAPPAPPAA